MLMIMDTEVTMTEQLSKYCVTVLQIWLSVLLAIITLDKQCSC